MMIKEFKDDLAGLKTILKEKEKLEMIQTTRNKINR